MNLRYCIFLAFPFFAACNNSEKKIVNAAFTDSLLLHYSPSVQAKTTDSNLLFWQRRMESLPDNFVNGPEYASTLAARFRMYGDIHDLTRADSLFKCSNKANQGKEPGLFRTLASLAMMQHRFKEADSFRIKAENIDGKTITNAFLDFDVSFELGGYARAKNILASLAKDKSYSYLFRRSKYEHYDGSLDTAISCLMQAAEKAGTNKYLVQVAVSNAADLCIHKGELKQAYGLYLQSIKIDAADFHSIMGIGWIALVQDKNDTLAERIFQFVHAHQKSPDALLKLEQVAEARGDSLLQKKYAAAFVQQVNDSAYGNMYNKYLIDIYTGILNQPAKAAAIALQETGNRSTPQTYAWYAWSLFCNNEKDKAYQIFKGFVSGKPLEGLELYYMGRLMKEMDKGYNAQQFFKAAWKNRYDLSPSKVKYLEKNLA
jgi:hypothetical protein